MCDVILRSDSANQVFDEDDLSKQKNQRMSTLLGFSTDPSREALLEELVKKGILAQVPFTNKTYNNDSLKSERGLSRDHGRPLFAS